MTYQEDTPEMMDTYSWGMNETGSVSSERSGAPLRLGKNESSISTHTRRNTDRRQNAYHPRTV
jgi:hypothetical protein